MNRTTSIKLKAAFILTVFALNTLVGFACTVGIDMGFNSTHHEEEVQMTDAPEHGSDHQHHSNGENDITSKNAKDNCCHDKVVKLAEVDKAIPQSLKTPINPLVLAGFASVLYNSIVLPANLHKPSIKYFVRSYHPPIPDIRLAIQSFLI